MGLAWQQGPLSRNPIGNFLTPEPLPERMLFAEPLRRRMRVQFNGAWIADSSDVVLLHEPGRYPVALFPESDLRDGVLVEDTRQTRHDDLGPVRWYSVTEGDRTEARAAWKYLDVPDFASELSGRVAFAWRMMDGFYEEAERIYGHAADQYHRNDIRQTSRHLIVRDGERVIADTTRAVVLYESGFAARWYVPRADIDEPTLTPAEGQTFCPYKGLASYYDIGERRHAAWYYPEAWPEVDRIRNLVSFEPDVVDVYLDGEKLRLEPGQAVIAHGVDRGLDTAELTGRN